MSANNWGRWGPDDEAGAVNLIGPDQVRTAASLIREGRAISLAVALSARTLVSKGRPPLGHYMIRDGGDYAAGARAPGGFRFADDAVMMSCHGGTHIDALCHVWSDEQLYNGFDQSSLRSSGATRCGVDKLPPVLCRGILLDAVRLTGGPLADGEAIGRAMVEALLAAAGTTIESGDAVLIRTGWVGRHDGASEADFDREPGIDVAAAEFLAASGVALVGADNFAIEQMPFPPGEVFPVHRLLLRDYGIPLIETMALDRLAAADRPVFAFVAAPLPIVGGSGSPLTPMAIL